MLGFLGFEMLCRRLCQSKAAGLSLGTCQITDLKAGSDYAETTTLPRDFLRKKISDFAQAFPRVRLWSLEGHFLGECVRPLAQSDFGINNLQHPSAVQTRVGCPRSNRLGGFQGEAKIAYSVMIGAVFVSFSIALASSCRRAVMGAGSLV